MCIVHAAFGNKCSPERKGKISRLDRANFMPNFAQMCDQPDIIMQNLEGCSNFFFSLTWVSGSASAPRLISRALKLTTM